jgi:hypothetical protein
MARVALEKIGVLSSFPNSFSVHAVMFTMPPEEGARSSASQQLTDDHRLISASISTHVAVWSTTLSVERDADLLTQLQQYITMHIQGAYNVWQP